MKTVIASAAGYLAGVAVAAVLTTGTIAILPISAAIVVGIFVGWALNSLDERFGITDSLVAALERYERQTLLKVERGVYYVIRSTGQAIIQRLQMSAVRYIHERIRRLPQAWQ